MGLTLVLTGLTLGGSLNLNMYRCTNTIDLGDCPCGYKRIEMNIHRLLRKADTPQPLCYVVSRANLGYWRPSTMYIILSGVVDGHQECIRAFWFRKIVNLLFGWK